MAWGTDVNFALTPSVQQSSHWGEMASEQRGREYKHDVADAQVKAEHQFKSERRQKLAQPFEDELVKLHEELTTLQAQKDQMVAEANKPTLTLPNAEQVSMFPTAENGGIGGSRQPTRTPPNINPGTPNPPAGYDQNGTKTVYQQQAPVEPQEIHSYGPGFTNMFDINDPSAGTPNTPSVNAGAVGGNRVPEQPVNPNQPPAGYDQETSFGQGFGPLANGRLPIQPLVQPQLQLFPKKQGRFF